MMTSSKKLKPQVHFLEPRLMYNKTVKFGGDSTNTSEDNRMSKFTPEPAYMPDAPMIGLRFVSDFYISLSLRYIPK